MSVSPINANQQQLREGRAGPAATRILYKSQPNTPVKRGYSQIGTFLQCRRPRPGSSSTIRGKGGVSSKIEFIEKHVRSKHAAKKTTKEPVRKRPSTQEGYLQRVSANESIENNGLCELAVLLHWISQQTPGSAVGLVQPIVNEVLNKYRSSLSDPNKTRTPAFDSSANDWKARRAQEDSQWEALKSSELLEEQAAEIEGLIIHIKALESRIHEQNNVIAALGHHRENSTFCESESEKGRTEECPFTFSAENEAILRLEQENGDLKRRNSELLCEVKVAQVEERTQWMQYMPALVREIENAQDKESDFLAFSACMCAAVEELLTKDNL